MSEQFRIALEEMCIRDRDTARRAKESERMAVHGMHNISERVFAMHAALLQRFAASRMQSFVEETAKMMYD